MSTIRTSLICNKLEYRLCWIASDPGDDLTERTWILEH